MRPKSKAIFSLMITFLASIVIIVFFVLMFCKYAPPNETNTYTSHGTVSDVYLVLESKKTNLEIAFENGETFSLVYPNTIKELYAKLGYDDEELEELLEGKEVEFTALKNWNWITNISVGTIRLDNTELTATQCRFTQIVIVLLGIIALVFPIGLEKMYWDKNIKSKKKKQNKHRDFML